MKCNICGGVLDVPGDPRTTNKGGDCLVCMAEITEDPACIRELNQIKWIEKSTYEELLRRWRFAPIGEPSLSGVIGEYFSKVMSEKKEGCDHVQASKNVRW